MTVAVCRDRCRLASPSTLADRQNTPNPTTVAKREYRGRIVAEAMWPPLLTDEVWHQLRDRLTPQDPDPDHRSEPDRARRRTFLRRTFLLTGGIAVCGICGTNLHAHSRQNGNRAYNCMSGPDRGGCGGVTSSASALDHHVILAVLASHARIQTEPPVPVEAQALPSLSQSPPSPRGIAELARLFTVGQLSSLAWQVARAGIAAVEAGTSVPQRASTALDGVLIERWRAMPLNRQRERITGVLAQVIVNRTHQRGPDFDHNRVEFRWHTDTTRHHPPM